jgi:hypothetical protein
MTKKKKEPVSHPERDWHVSFLSSVLGEFDSKTEDGTLYWQDFGVDYENGRVVLWPANDDAWQKAYMISGYCRFNKIPCIFEDGGNDGH